MMLRNRWCALAVGILLASTALAEEHGEPQHAEPTHASDATHAADAAHGDGHGGHDKPALLQFDPGAAIWSIIIFVALLIVLRATAWKPILRVLNEREEFIRKSIDEAKEERAAAQELLAEYKAQLEKARQEASAIVDEGRRDAEVVGQRVKNEARQEAEQLVERAHREIQLAADTAVKELYDQTAELAVTVAGGILRKEISPTEHQQLVAESLAKMKSAGRPGLN